MKVLEKIKSWIKEYETTEEGQLALRSEFHQGKLKGLKQIEEEFKHECVFGFENITPIYEPEEGERGFSMHRGDWVCRCGKTRREYLKELRKK